MCMYILLNSERPRRRWHFGPEQEKGHHHGGVGLVLLSTICLPTGRTEAPTAIQDNPSLLCVACIDASFSEMFFPDLETGSRSIRVDGHNDQ